MASKDRMIIPFVCTECGAPLKRNKPVCEFCRVEWEMVKRYEGPELPEMPIVGISNLSFNTANCSFPTIHLDNNYGSAADQAAMG